MNIFGTPLLGESYGIIWSAKSASTGVHIWHFAEQGLLEEATACDRNPHTYRERILERSSAYRRRKRNLLWTPRAWVRVIRDPYRRTVSSFRHALRYDYIWKRIGKILGRNVDATNGFSFDEFLGFLELSNIESPSCNEHFRAQNQFIEKAVPLPFVLNADVTDVFEGLDGFAARHNLSVGDVNLRKEAFSRLGTHHFSILIPVEHDSSKTSFNAEDSVGKWPDYPSFLDQASRHRIEKIYQRDFEAYSAFLKPGDAQISSIPAIPKDFDPQAYLRINPDVAAAGVDPVVHYLRFGKSENRSYKDP